MMGSLLATFTSVMMGLFGSMEVKSAVVREQIRDEIVRCTWSSSFFVEYYLELIERPFFLPSVRIKSSFFIALFIGILTII